jgi:hypothetical protein
MKNGFKDKHDDAVFKGEAQLSLERGSFQLGIVSVPSILTKQTGLPTVLEYFFMLLMFCATRCTLGSTERPCD